MADATINLSETLDLEDLLILQEGKVDLYSYESLTLTLSDYRIPGIPLSESLDLVDGGNLPGTFPFVEGILNKTISKSCDGETIVTADISFPGKIEARDTFDLKLYRDGSSLSVDIYEVFRMRITRKLRQGVSEAEIWFDNDPIKDYRAGDCVVIRWGTEGLLKKIFSGEIDGVDQIYQDGEPLIKLFSRGWGKLLLEQKTELHISPPANVQEIATDIVSSITDTLITPCKRKISINNIESSYKTRTLDFVGESLWDALELLCDVSDSDFFVDANKDLNYFSSTSRVTGTTLTTGELYDYTYRKRYDLICNTIKVFGHDNRTIPYIDLDNPDPWCENTTNSSGVWTPTNPTNFSITRTTLNVIAGDYSIDLECDSTPTGSTFTYDVSGYHTSYVMQPTWKWLIGVGLPSVSGQKIQIEKIDIYSYVSSWTIPPYGPNTRGRYKIGLVNEGYGSASKTITSSEFADTSPTLHTHTSATNPSELPFQGNTGKSVDLWFYGQVFDIIGNPWMAAGNITIYYTLSGNHQNLGAKFTLSSDSYVTLINEVKWRPRTIEISLYPSFANKSTGQGEFPTAILYLHFSDGTNVYKNVTTGILIEDRWTGISEEIGPEAEGWSGICSGTITAIEIQVTNPKVPNTDDYLLIDYLHFDGAKWYGEYGIDNPEESTYGLKYLEILDDTIYSNIAAQRRASAYVQKHQEPLDEFDDVYVDYYGAETLRPGDTLTVSVPEATVDVRIIEIRYEYEEGDLTIGLRISVDP